MSDWPDGYGRRILDTVDSTLNEAGRIAPGLSGPEWILARQQTAARGRRGRAYRIAQAGFVFADHIAHFDHVHAHRQIRRHSTLNVG